MKTNHDITESLSHVGTRVSRAVVDKIDAAAVRLRVDRSHVIRWVLEEMPKDFTPRPAKPLKER